MVAFMNTVSSVVLATLLSFMLFATQGVNANALTDTLTGKINTPATNTTKNITDQARINQFILKQQSQTDCPQSTLDVIWGCTLQNCTCDDTTSSAVTKCLSTLVTNSEINDGSRKAIGTQYNVTCASKNQRITGFNGASRFSYGTGLISGVVVAAILSVVV